jgi:hypothetical protein
MAVAAQNEREAEDEFGFHGYFKKSRSLIS